jgi:PKD repeat protein
VPQAAAATTDTLTAIHDAKVRSSSPTSNYGADSTLRARFHSTGEWRSFVSFDLSTITGSVSGAVLRLFATNGSPDGGAFHEVDDFDESTLTWQTAPTLNDFVGQVSSVSNNVWVEVDVTGAVAANIDGIASFGFSSASPNSVLYSTKEGGTAPELVVTSDSGPPINTPPISPDTTQSTDIDTATDLQLSATDAQECDVNFTVIAGPSNGTLDPTIDQPCTPGSPNADTATVRYTPDPGYVGPDAISYRADDGTNTGNDATITIDVVDPAIGTVATMIPTDDAKVRSTNPTRNYGSDTTLRARADSPEWRSFVQFDLSSITGIVTDAVLRLYATDGSSTGGSFHYVDESWSESTITYESAPPLDDPITAAGAIADDSWLEINVTAAVQADGDGLVSFGVESPSANSVFYSSKEGANPPELVITSTTQPPVAPVSAFSVSPVSGTAPLVVTFTDQSSGTPTSWAWDFDDDGTVDSTIQNPVHTYGTAGVYKVSLTVGNAGGSDSHAKPDHITVAAPTGDPVIAAAGDIACSSTSSDFNGGQGTSTACRQLHTSDLLIGAGLTAVLPLGDLQYPTGTLAEFQASYDPSWGRVKGITFPAPGNHDYDELGAAGYFQYFGPVAGDPAEGYYSFDVGDWHVVSLNSNCGDVGGCDAGSTQEQWLRNDLANNPRACTLAYWHHPRFSSGFHGDDSDVEPLWRALYEAGADVALSGHDHDYERFALQTATGALDTAYGIRQFVVGTGGKSLRPLAVLSPNSEVFDSSSFGVLFMTLRADAYEWQFVPDSIGTFTDSGSQNCHGAPPPDLNEAPTSQSSTVSTTIDVAVDLELVATDPEECELNFTVLTGPTNGTLATTSDQPCSPGTPNTDTATIEYTPGPGYEGPDSMTYRADDGTDPGNIVTISIDVNAPPSADTLLVPAEYPTIQAAVDAAVTGDTVLVSPGTYGPVNIIGKDITLASEFLTTSDPARIASTIIDGGGQLTAMLVQDTTIATRIVGFTIQNADDGLTTDDAFFEFSGNVVRNTADGIDYEKVSGGVVRNSVFENNTDDGIDLDDSIDLLVEDSIIRNNGNDGIEIRLFGYTGPVLDIVVRRTQITGNDNDGIQLIGYPEPSNRNFVFERNIIADNGDAGIGLMDNTISTEDFRGAPLTDPIRVENNVFDNNAWAMTGGANTTFVNNAVLNSTLGGLKNLTASSSVTYTGFWQNSVDTENVNTGAGLVFSEPFMNPDYTLNPQSPYVDGGDPSCVDPNQTICDIGRFEFGGGGGPFPPVADFTATPLSGNDPLLVQFSDVSLLSPTSWAWDFDGDQIIDSTAQNPTHGYLAAGNYTVTLTATNAAGSDTETKVGFITVVSPGSEITTTFAPTDDAKVRSTSATKNYGDEDTLRNRFDDSEWRTYVQFEPAGLTGSVTQAILRLYVTDTSPSSGSVFASGTGWSESGLTWANAPPPGPQIAPAIAATAGWIEFDVTSAVAANGQVSFAMTTSSTNSVFFSSKEGAFGPELVVTTVN